MRRDTAVLRLFEEIKRLDREDVLSPRDKACEIISFLEHKIGMKPVKTVPSGCMHTMREMCNCQTEYDFTWDK